MARFNFGGSNPFDVFGSGVSDKPTQPPVSPEVLEAINARKDANAAASAATNQYEADIADFKNTQATEMDCEKKWTLGSVTFPTLIQVGCNLK